MTLRLMQLIKESGIHTNIVSSSTEFFSTYWLKHLPSVCVCVCVCVNA